MATIQEQLQRKRFPIDTWDIKEKLLLASAVCRSGDQNWMSVSRLMKTLGHATRPSDWYSQKNCAAQYGLLLENVETPKRKKRSGEQVIETPSESILRRLREERMIELKRIMAEERKLYMKLKEEINMVKSGFADEAQLREMCLQIEQENKQKEKEAQIYAEWLKQREEKKLELERQWRPQNKIFIQAPQKRKISDTENTEIKVEEDKDEKPGMSPLLTSLLKSPSQVSNNSILHSAITNQTIRGASPTIASLLNSSPEVNVSPGLQQLVSTAIQEPTGNQLAAKAIQAIETNFLPCLDLKKEELPALGSSLILGSDNIDEEMQLIEEVIKNVEENESKELLERKEAQIDQNKIGEIKNELDKTLGTDPEPEPIIPEVVETVPVVPEEPVKPEIVEDVPKVEEKEIVKETEEIKTEVTEEEEKVQEPKPEIREVSIVLEDIGTTETKAVPTPEPEVIDEKSNESEPKVEEDATTETESQEGPSISDDSNETKIKEEIKTEPEPTLTDDSDFDENSREVLKVKRDYSRLKKKDDKEIQFLLDDDKLEMANEDPGDLEEFIESLDKKEKRSESPWTEEESETLSRTKRRYSTPATPSVSDSVPNSPASSLADREDDRDHRAWKKSVMLVYNRLSTHKYASLFLKPITNDQAPNYHSLIREPKDLQTLRRHIDNGSIKTTQEFIKYVLLMFQNAIMYNKTNNYVYGMARDMQSECIEHIHILVQAQQQVETVPARRETRTSDTPGGTKKEQPKSRKRKSEF